MILSRRRMIALAAAVLVCLIAGALIWASWPRAEVAPYQYGRPDRQHLKRMTMMNHQAIMDELFGTAPIDIKTVGILVYDGAHTMEAVGPMVVFSELMSVKIHYIAPDKGVIKTDHADLIVDQSIGDIDKLDLLVVPGGTRTGLTTVLQDARVRDWLKQIDATSKMTAGVGNGSILLAKAGLLANRQIALPWPDAEANALTLGARFSSARYQQDDRYWTSVGGTAVLDQTLAMVKAIAGERYLQAAMLDLEYAPEPPIPGGNAALTPETVQAALRSQAFEIDGLHLIDGSRPEHSEVSADSQRLQIGILVYQDFFTLDAIGPLVMLSNLDNADVRLVRVGAQRDIKSGRSHFQVTDSIDDVTHLDVLIVPGGSSGTWAMTQNPRVLQWIQDIDRTSRYTGSVCTGSWILGAAGLLKGKKATTNWYRAGQMMARYEATFEPARFVRDDKYWTSAGVSAGIDLSVAMITDLAGTDAAHAAMLSEAYAPEPPIRAGTPELTDDLVLDMMHQMYDFFMVPLIKPDEQR